MKSRSRKSLITLIMAAIVMLFLTGAEDSGCGPLWTGSYVVADAGPDQTVMAGTVVILNGSESYSDIVGNRIVSYEWSIIAPEPPVVLEERAIIEILLAPGIYKIQLTVRDDVGFTDRDEVTITVEEEYLPPPENTPPVADAGEDQTISLSGSPVLVNLDGNGSWDVDEDPLTYEWSITFKPEGSTVVLSDDTAVKPTFLADIAGSYVMRLIVNDGKASSLADDVTITVLPYLPPPPENTPPVADAGEDQSVDIGSTVNLDGSGSSDADDDPLTYEWSITFKPEGSTAGLSNDTAVKPTFLADMAGSYVMRLIVNDGKANSLADDVTITVSDPSLISLSKTGQTKSYDLAGNEVTDGSLKDDGFYQYGINFSFSNNGDGTINDNNTLLIWEQGYAENLALGAAGDYCTAKGPEWRIPNLYEYFTILNYWENSALDGTYFNVPVDGYYWTNTNEAGSSLNYWTINVTNGQVPTAAVPNTNTNYVRCVKGEELIPPSSERFTKIGTDGSLLEDGATTWVAVKDNWTGLLWEKTNTEFFDGWTGAINYCEDLVLAGRSSWHLPNIKQVHYVMDMTKEDSALDSAYFSKKNAPLWTSTTDMFNGLTYVWGVYQVNGTDEQYGIFKYGTLYDALCVSWEEP